MFVLTSCIVATVYHFYFYLFYLGIICDAVFFISFWFGFKFPSLLFIKLITSCYLLFRRQSFRKIALRDLIKTYTDQII